MVGLCGWRRGVAVIAAATCLAGLPAGSASAAVGPGFFGVAPQGTPAARDLDRMRGTIGTLRLPVLWSQSEPRPGQFEFGQLDEVIGAAADRGIRVLPFVYGSPAWIAPDLARPPLRSPATRAAWGAFMRRLAERYGSGGDFWRDRRQRLPIRRWQIWNEPNFVLFWRPRPSPRGYARLLEIAARAIHSRDPGAEIVTAGVAPVGAGMRPWEFLRRLYRVPGAKRDFDLVAIHPYSVSVANMAAQIRITREVMARAGDDATPLLVSELGVASVGSLPSAFVKGPAGQARFLRLAYGLLLAERHRWRIAGIDWFTWQDIPGPDLHCAFCQGAGLLDVDGRAKPAWWALRRIVAAALARPVR
jgi:hypothetical protein